MAGALMLASVTSALKHLLDNRLMRSGVAGSFGEVTVSALSPDRVPVGAEERSQLNLFLFRVSPHTRWQPTNGATQKAESTDRRALALNLHYLLSAYGEQDYQAEILLGHAIQLLHETPTLRREVIQEALTAHAHNGAGGIFGAAGKGRSTEALLDGVTELTITPAFLSMEDASRLWSTLQARYRPSVAYEVSAVSIGEVE